MKQPTFWNKKKSILKTVLTPLGKLYAYCVKRRLSKANNPYQPKVPVICVGNIAVGGTGKTPTALAVADYFIKQGKKVVFLSHGYKSEKQGEVVDLKHPEGFGDEAILLAQKAPTVVDRNRGRGAAKAEKMGADVIIMDDGFQNPGVVKTFSFLVFNGTFGVGNGACLPAGPLRESLKDGLKRADAIVIVGGDKTHLAGQIQKINAKIPIIHGQLRPFESLEGVEGFAFAGIGYPEKFFDMLCHEGVLLTGTKVFPDHHPYTEEEVKKLLAKESVLLTTSKDIVKIPEKYRDKIKVVDVYFDPVDPDLWRSVLGGIL